MTAVTTGQAPVGPYLAVRSISVIDVDIDTVDDIETVIVFLVLIVVLFVTRMARMVVMMMIAAIIGRMIIIVYYARPRSKPNTPGGGLSIFRLK